MMLDANSIDGIGMLLAKLRRDFDLPLYEVTKAAEEVFGGRPWKRIIQRHSVYECDGTLQKEKENDQHNDQRK